MTSQMASEERDREGRGDSTGPRFPPCAEWLTWHQHAIRELLCEVAVYSCMQFRTWSGLVLLPRSLLGDLAERGQGAIWQPWQHLRDLFARWAVGLCCLMR